MASISEPKSSFSEIYAKENIDITCDFKSWILCKEPFLTLTLTLAVEENKSKLVNVVSELMSMVVLM